jgi:hypothetical protein
MVVFFSKQESNYTQNNLVNLLQYIPEQGISYLANHLTDSIIVKGDIHRSQYSSSNPDNYFWFKIEGYQDGEEIKFMRSIHIFVCFRLYKYSHFTKGYIAGDCINPESYTDIADVGKLTGQWEFAGITYGH